jgi:prepilin-type N-terminal cleavage/methylation domain-containing protein
MIDLGNKVGVNRGAERRAFSLIELLVVIGVIALIAAMVLGLLPAVTEKRTRARVQAELSALVMAIESYKEKHGFYPPDGVRSGQPETNIAQPPLFYELVGTTNKDNSYYPVNGEPGLTAGEISANFAPGQDGFLNSGAEASEVKNFYPTLRKSQYDRSPYGPVLTLMVPAKGPVNTAYPRTRDVNPWRYVVATPGRADTLPSPRHNVDTFDLWAEVVHGGKTNVIGNWRK